MKKKIISSILSLAMLLSLLPVAAFAADTAPATEPGTVVTKDDESVILANYNNDLASAPWTSAKLEITSVTAANVQNSTPKTVNISLTVNDLRAHENKDSTRGYWIGIGVPQVEGNAYKTGWGNGTDTTGAGTAKDDEQLVGQSSKYDTFYWGSDATKLVGDNKQGYIEVTNNSVVTRYVITFHVTVAPAEITDMGFFASADKANTVIGALKGSPLTGVDVCAPDTMYVAVDQLCGPLHNYIATLTGPDNTILKYNSSTATGDNVFDYDNGNSGKYVLYFTFDKTVQSGSWVYSGTDTRVGAADGKYTFKLYTLPETSTESATIPNGDDAVAVEESITLASVTVKKDATPANDVVVYFNKDAKDANQVSIADLLGNKTIAEPEDTENQSFLGWVINDNDEPISTEALKALTTKPTASVVYKAKMAQTVNISFDKNNATTGDNPATVKVAKDGKLTTDQVASIEAAAAALSKTGHIFDGWATRGGTEGNYTYTKVNLDTATFSENTTLYAQWKVAGVTSATLLDGTNAAVSGTTVTATAPAAGAEKGKLAITGCIPAPTEGAGTTYKVSYVLEGKEIAETPVEITIKADGENLTATPEDVTLGAIVYTADLSGLSALAAGVSIKDSGTPAVEEVKASETVDLTGTTATAVQTKIEQTVGSFDTNNADLSAALKTEADKIVESEGAPANAVTVDKLLAEVPANDVNKAKYDEIIVVPILAIELKALNPTEQTMTLQITPKIQYQAIDGDDSNVPAYPVSEPVAVSNPKNVGEVTISFAQPTFVSAPATTPLYVVHDSKYVYDASWDAGNSVYTFNNPNGFSDFVITTENPTAATISGAKYATLADAITAVSTDGTSTITLAAGYTAAKQGTISGINKSFSIDAASVSPAFDDAAKTALKTAVEGAAASGYTVAATWSGTTLSVTATANTTPPPSGPSGGGSGVSSNVTIDRPTNGKVSVTPTAPSKGATVTINLTPDTGYAVGTVTVTDKDGKAVELTKVNDTQYTFVMPDGKVTVKATFTKVDAPATGFTDVPADAYYADAVKWAVDKGITNGLTATTFGPNNSCTRGQMVTFLWRAAGSPATTGTNSFSDVASGEYYYNAVLWAVEKGITNGTSATTFSPNATVNRGQTVTFLYRYAESPAATGTTSFTDVTADAFYADAVKWAVAEGITNGTSSTTFSPASNCTRGQIVTFMYRQMAE